MIFTSMIGTLFFVCLLHESYNEQPLRYKEQYNQQQTNLTYIENSQDFKISYLIPMFNQAKYIETCILNIMKQDHQNFEILIVDYGSTDNSVNIVKQMI